MKLWFEGWNVNALDALPLLRTPRQPLIAALTGAINSLEILLRMKDGGETVPPTIFQTR
jgi:hypothetical protein